MLLVMSMIGIAFAIVFAGSFMIGKTNIGVFIFGGIIAGMVALSIALKPEGGLYVLIVFVFANVSDVLEVAFKIPSTNKPLVALIFVGTLGSRIVLQRKQLIFRTTEISILVFGLALIASLFTAVDKTESISIAVDWVKDFAILIIMVQLCTRESVYKKAIWAVILTAGFLSLLSTYQNITRDFANNFYGLANAPVHQITSGFDSVRVTGPLDDPNYYGMILLSVLPAAIYRFFDDEKRWRRILGGICAGLIVTTVILTYSRGGFVALIVVSALIIRDRKMNPYKIAGIIIFALVVVSPILPKGFAARITTLGGFVGGDEGKRQTESSFRGRTSEMIVAVQMFQDRPIFGVGRDNYPKLYQHYSRRVGLDDRTQEREAHNLYLETAAEMGIVGLAAFTIMIIAIFKGLFSAKQDVVTINRHDLVPWISGIQYGLVAYLVASIFLHGSNIRYFWLIISFSLASRVMVEQLLAQHQRRRREQSQTSALPEIITQSTTISLGI
jgi:O-antigen ligase